MSMVGTRQVSQKALLLTMSALVTLAVATPAAAGAPSNGSSQGNGSNGSSQGNGSQGNGSQGNGSQGNGSSSVDSRGGGNGNGNSGNGWSGANGNALSKYVAKGKAKMILTGPAGGDINPFQGDIDAFWGDISPFYGNIDAFWGDINPFEGDINAFEGDINAFEGDINAFWGDINPFEGDINAFAAAPNYEAVGDFWRGMGSFWKDLDADWGALGPLALNLPKYEALKVDLNELVTRSEAVFGPAVTAKTGKSFREGFANAVFAKYGVNLNVPASYAGMSDAVRAHFFLDWYDGLMSYTNADHIDHWMGEINWTPALTQIQGAGSGTIIGLLDSTVANDPDVLSNITSAAGYSNTLAGHGTGVASLMVADHDGRGVMGIAPRASVVAYNPFDDSGTAGWADVKKGIIALQAAGASVINMSLGVSGYTLHSDWNAVFGGVAHQNLAKTVFVVAAGNSGTTQAESIDWDFDADPALLVVGSIDPSGRISNFSNRPGTACLLNNGSCQAGHRLMDRFIVAPGELILMSDGQGGLTRRSGTSFAAPLVSGAVALLHDRWPWLANYPKESVEIILRSAKDLGAPGVDAVYGWGLLDVEASQSPLNFSQLKFYEYRNGVATERTAAQVKASGIQTTWEADGAFFTAFETIGGTKRDFLIPLSSRLVGQKSNVTGSQEYFQSYIHGRLTDWIAGATSFTDVATQVIDQPGHWSLAISAGMPHAFVGDQDLAEAPHAAFRMADPSGKFALNAGHGAGAMVLGQTAGFAMSRDYGSQDAGVNPLLGFASGGAFASVDYALTKRTTLSFGATERRLEHEHNPDLTESARQELRNVADYTASAVNLRVTQRVSDAVTFSAGYAQLREANGLLGVQSLAQDDLSHGSTTDVATFGVDVALPQRLTFGASSTTGRTRTGGRDQTFSTDGDVVSSAWAVAITKQGLVGKHDLLRFSLVQPLRIERGSLSYDSVEVIDRTTGEIGAVRKSFDITGGERRHVAEALYATPMFDGEAELNLFGRAETQSAKKVQDYMLGARVNFDF